MAVQNLYEVVAGDAVIFFPSAGRGTKLQPLKTGTTLTARYTAPFHVAAPKRKACHNSFMRLMAESGKFDGLAMAGRAEILDKLAR